MITAASGNLADLLRAAASAHPDRPALIDGDNTRTWADLDAAADAGAGALADTGLPVGARVLIALPTGADIAAALFATARAGLVSVPIDPHRRDLALIAGRVQADVGIALTRDHGRLTAFGPDELARWWTASPEPHESRCGGEDIAIIARASHSNRAVMLTHRAVLAAASAVLTTPRLQLRSSDRVVLALPLHHLAGFVTVLLPLAGAGAAGVIPAEGVEGVLAAIKAHRVTILPGTPGLYHQLRSADGAERALATVRLMTSGAAPLDPVDFAGLRKLTGQPVWEGYGISESSSAVASSLMTAAARPGSVGRPVAGVELRIVDPTDDAADPATGATDDGDAAGDGDDEIVAEVGDSGEVGRIAVRGPTLFSGYWPDRDGAPGPDGWFLTGDIGYLDDAGELHLVDRAAETVTVAGFTVYPRQIEEVLGDHPYIAEAAVVGVPGPAGQTLVAVLAARPGTHPTDDDVAEFVAARMPAFKRPSAYHLMDALPRTELGRLDRQAVLQRYAEETGISLAVPVSALTPVRIAQLGAENAEPGRPGDESADGDGEPDTGTAEPGESDADRPGSQEQDAEPTPDTTPEAAGDLEELGTRLPGTTQRRRRSEQDTDEDLFGDEVL